MSKDHSRQQDSTSMYLSGYKTRNNAERLNSGDQMSPGLLDRLTDDNPENQKKELNRNIVTHQILRRQVLRDLQWLFNSINNESQHDFRPFSRARDSVINFGIEPLAGKRMSEIVWDDVHKNLRRAILKFEPRIIPQDLRIHCITEIKSMNTHNTLSIEIKGNLWCVPWPLAFLFRTDLDLEHSRFYLQDLG